MAHANVTPEEVLCKILNEVSDQENDDIEDDIVPTPGLAFSLLIPRTLVAALSFLSGRAYLFLNFLPPLFLRLIPTLIM